MEDKTEGWTERYGQYPKEGWAIFWSNQSSKDDKHCYQLQKIDELKILSNDDEAIPLAKAKGFIIGSENNPYEVMNFKKEINYISLILERKIQGQDCTENQSAEIKMFLKEEADFTNEVHLELTSQISEHFPVEYSEAFDEMGQERARIMDAAMNNYDTAKICERIKNRIESNHHTADEVINMIADTLREADTKFIEHIANQILTSNVKLLNNDGEDIFELS